MFALLGYSTADLLVRWLPLSASQALAVVLARAAFALRLPARRAVLGNLERLGDGARAGHARAAFEHFARSIVDFLRLARLDRAGLQRAIELRGHQHLAAAEASGRGVIVLSAHLGSWEWGAALLGSRGVRLHVVARPHAHPRIEAFFGRRRARWGVTPLPTRAPWTRAAQALRRREWVALMGDRAVPGAGPTCAWAAALARRTGAVLLPAIMLRLPDGRHAACFEAPLSPAECADGGYRALLRCYLERYPEQWAGFEPLPEGVA